jgi:hypothetical protein
MNSKTARYFVIAEVLVCFVPLAAMLFAGLLFAPFVVVDMFDGRFESWMYLVVVVCGVAGFTALFQVLKWLFGRQTDRLGRWWTLALMLLGLLPVAVIVAVSLIEVLSGGDAPWYMVPVFAAPILVAAHLAYLARQYLFTSTESRVSL